MFHTKTASVPSHTLVTQRNTALRTEGASDVPLSTLGSSDLTVTRSFGLNAEFGRRPSFLSGVMSFPVSPDSRVYILPAQ